MAEAFNLLRRVKSLDISPEQPAYSGVVIFAGQDEEGNDIEYRAGSRTGTVLEITNEWGSQAQANAIYRKIRGYKYQPYRATGSQLDPSAEIGDAVTVNDTYGGVFIKASTYGKHISTDIEAPSKEEVEHEFQTQSPTNRQYERFARSVRSSLSITASQIAAEVEDRKAEDNLLRATLNVQAQEIDARVTKEGGDSSSFGWKLTATGWSVYGNGSEIFGVDRSGAYVNGEIRSKTGKIGNWDINSSGLSYNGQTWGGTNTKGAYIGQSGIQLGKNFKVDMQGNLTAASGTFKGEVRATSGKIGGFDIKSNYLSYNGQTWGGTNTKGAYIGQSGIQLGKNFKVDMQGNLTAASGKFLGSVNAGNIQYGGSAGYFSGSGLSSGSVYGGSGGAIAGSSLSPFNLTGGVNTSLAYADYANGVFSGWNKCQYLSAYKLFIGDKQLATTTISFLDHSGNKRTLNVVGWSY